MLDATLESFPQCIIQMFYLIRIGTFDNHSFNGNFSNNLIIVSLAFSIFNITSRTISEDKIYFHEHWRYLQFDWQPFHVNWRYIARFVWRLLDISARFGCILSMWLRFGGMITFIYICFESFVLILFAIKTKRYDLLILNFCPTLSLHTHQVPHRC